MKVSYGIFIVGILLLSIIVFLTQSDLGNSDHLMFGLVSEDVYDKIITLYFFIVIMQFFSGGIVYYFERGMPIDKKTIFSEAEFDLEENDLNEKYIEYVKTRSTRENPLM